MVTHKSLKYGVGVRRPLSIGVFGGVNPGAIEALGAFAALSRCGAVIMGGLSRASRLTDFCVEMVIVHRSCSG